MIGQTISHYKILEKLGEGGMGVVYKAHDSKLDRIVALKFLPFGHATDESERARFLQEARAASGLSHPNICHINAIEDVTGQQFIDMEFVDGTTLRRKLPVQKISDALGYAIQIGEALQEAHSKGIVHRDIKSDNIMINSRNQVKVMDFGLAKLKGSMKLTKTSSTVGTLAYMAPEQIHGEAVDARSDIFSFGVVLFEILTGHMPFHGEHEAAMMYSILNEEPESIQNNRQDVSAEIDRIIRRALEKDPADRYQHADDLVSELRRVQKQSTKVSRPTLRDMSSHPADEPTPRPATAGGSARRSGTATVVPQETYQDSSRISPTGQPRGRRRQFMVLGGILIVLTGAAIGYFSFFGKHQSIDSLAVLPFTNIGADPNTEYLSDGITESLINNLSQISSLTVMSRSSVFHYKGKEIDPLKTGKELGVKAILTGMVSPRGDMLVISTELVDVTNNSHIWGEQYNRKLSDILAVQQEISKEISDKLRLKLAGEDQKKLEKRSTENADAYQLYLKGRFHWNKRKADDLHKAVEYYNQAIERDPDFALAYAGLASTYVILPEYAGLPAKDLIPKTETAAKKALELDPTLAEPHAVLGLMKTDFEWDWNGAEEEFKRAIQLNPNYPTTHHWYNICLRIQGEFDRAMAEIKRAQELDPLSLIINQNVAEVFIAMRRYDQAIEQLKKTLELDPNFPGARDALGMVYAQQGKFDEAVNELKKVREIVGAGNPFGIEGLGYVYGKAGRKDEAMKILNQLLDFSQKGYAVSVQIATVYAGLGDKDKAFQWIEKGYDEQNQNLGYLKIAGVWDNLRSDPRYTAVLKKIRLEK